MVSLRKPTYSVTDLAHGPLDPATTLSPRVTPQMIGLGLVEQIHPADILAHADPDDRDGDGISGKAAIVRDRQTGELTLGRFGWKASDAVDPPADRRCFCRRHRHLDAGCAAALGRLHRGREADCLAMPSGVQKRLGPVEAPTRSWTSSPSIRRTLPCRRGAISTSRMCCKGKKLFYESGCISCHTPKFVTRRDAPNKAQAFQLIWPYSDFLLHDMGDGLADGQQVGDATGNEWRTPPLWGIGPYQDGQRPHLLPA